MVPIKKSKELELETEQEIERKIEYILSQLAELEAHSAEAEQKLLQFSKQMFGFERDWKREEIVCEDGHCGMIQYRVTNIQTIISDIEDDLNQILSELPQTK